MSAPWLEFRSESAAVVPASFYAPHGKRLFDLAAVLVIAPFVIPLVLVILAITAASGSWPLYAQRRVGKGGRLFRCWKIRTMIPDADSVLQRLVAENADMAAEWSKNQKLTYDPRVTGFGRILRKTSLDELPQLWNVLTGSMSLVGPRPFTPDQMPMYLRGQHDVPYLHIQPGITGLWQISLRSQGSFAERATYDQLYANSMSFGLDMLILARTAIVVFRGTGV